MKQNSRLWIALILALIALTLLLYATSCDTVDGEAASSESSAETDVDLSALAPHELYEYARSVTEAQTYAQMTVTGTVELTNRDGETSTYPLSLVLSRDGTLTHIRMTDPDGHTREMTDHDGDLYWSENGERLRIQLGEDGAAAMLGALDYSFQNFPSGVDKTDYTNCVTEFPAIDTLFSTVTAERNGQAAAGEPAYTFAMTDAIGGEAGRFFCADTLKSVSMTASALADGRMSDMTITGVWEITDVNAANGFYILPILADTLGMESEYLGNYRGMTWSLSVAFSYETKTLTAPEPSAEDIRLTRDEVMGAHHVIPFADITISYGTYESGVLPEDAAECVVSVDAKEGKTLASKGQVLCWVIYRIEDGEETRISTYKGHNQSTASLEDSYSEIHATEGPIRAYLPLEPGEYKMVLQYITVNAFGNTFEEKWDIAGVTTFRVEEVG